MNKKIGFLLLFGMCNAMHNKTTPNTQPTLYDYQITLCELCTRTIYCLEQFKSYKDYTAPIVNMCNFFFHTQFERFLQKYPQLDSYTVETLVDEKRRHAKILYEMLYYPKKAPSSKNIQFQIEDALNDAVELRQNELARHYTVLHCQLKRY